MTIKIVGVIFIFISCAGVGFGIASNYIKEERTLRQLVHTLDYMECELQYRLTPMPTLCRSAAAQSTGLIRNVFLSLAIELEDQIHPDVWHCMASVLGKTKDIPDLTGQALETFGRSFGQFDIEGQLKGLETVRSECRRNLNELALNRTTRVRSYQTLGLCVGAAVAILFI